MHKPIRRAFTLIDTAVACALIALVVAALLPALRSNRNASQGQVSRANLKLLVRGLLAYASSNQDRWLNPFDPTTSYQGHPGMSNPNWHSIPVSPGSGLLWMFNDAGYETELFSAHWASLASRGPQQAYFAPATQFDPRDAQFIQRYNAAAQDPIMLQNLLTSTSYMYSPTMWFSQQRYASAARLFPAAPSVQGGTRSVRYNRTSETLYASQKAVLFQRFDFDVATRNDTTGTVSFSPQWNNPVAVPDVAFADGSVDEVSIRKVQLAINASAEVADWLTPTSPNWVVPSSVLNNYDLGSGWENGQGNTTARSAFFWGTRNGVAGRDVPRR